MTGSILYCGDTELNGAAAYLAGLMELWQRPYDYVPSQIAVSIDALKEERSVIIVSDYPASQFSLECQKLALEQIERGCGFLMIGGWESFHGAGGNWDQSLLGSILPVEIQSTDDRLNFDQPAWLLSNDEASTNSDQESPKIFDLPWFTCPPAIGGMNRTVEKPSGHVLLHAHRLSVSAAKFPSSVQSDAIHWNLAQTESLPALVVGNHGMGRTAAFMSDIAPHWVGGFVDWGLPRVTAQAKNAPAIEVGGHYARFWKQLLDWLGHDENQSESEGSE